MMPHNSIILVPISLFTKGYIEATTGCSNHSTIFSFDGFHTKKLAELKVKITKGANKRPQVTEERTNIWCNICKGHGDLSNEFPTPK